MESAPKLSTPEEELAYLRERVAEKEAELAKSGEIDRVKIISETIYEHHTAPQEVLVPEYRLNEETKKSEADAILAELELGDDEQVVKNLRQMMEEKGVKNALGVVEKMGNARVADDFHRYLVRYVAAGLPAFGLDEKAPRFQALHMTLYEIVLPGPKNDESQSRTKTLKELISGMEQFYAGLLSVGDCRSWRAALLCA